MEDVKKGRFAGVKASFIALFASVLLCFGFALVQAPEKAYAADADKYLAQIEIKNYGTVTVELDRNAAPKTVDNFVSLARSGFYDGLKFHRITNFCIQGGDPKGNGTGGSDTKIKGEFAANGWNNPISHKRGVISMARGEDYNSASSQFFITTTDSSSSLDGKYAAFGRVVSGMDAIDSLVKSTYVINEQPIFGAPVISSITVTPCVTSNGWKKSGDRWWFKYDAATAKAKGKEYPTNEVVAINGKWYRFDSKGWMRTGWVKDSGKWYYHGGKNDGSMQTGWKKVGGKWYYMAGNGIMQTGKQSIGGKTYLLTSSGAMKTGWSKEDGKWYYYGSSGEMYAGTLTRVGKYHYLFEFDGSMQTGLKKVNEDSYYFNSSGALVTGWVKDKGKWYYFDYYTATMAKNRWIGGKYWVGSDGAMATSSWVDNNKYYVDASGKWVPNAQRIN